MSQKPPRTVQEFQIDIAETAQKIGLLQYQLEREIPAEISKHMNHMHDLDREGKKLIKAAQDAGHETTIPAEDPPDHPLPEGENPGLTVVPTASN